MSAPVYESVEHTFDGERCTHCGINVYDWDDERCVPHEPVAYTTESTPSDLDVQLEVTLAEAGRVIEAMPWDERMSRARDVLVKFGLVDADRGSQATTFLVGVFVQAHMDRLRRNDPSAMRAYAAALMAQADRLEAKDRTGLAATWCPTHGD